MTDQSPTREDLIERDIAGETVCGYRVAAYRETHPEHGDKYGHRYSEHWSTPSRDPRVKVERLFTEDQLRDALLRSDSQRIAELEGEAERLKEAGARAVYDQWTEDPEFVPWVPGGNSLKQDEARRRFRKAFETLPNLCAPRALELALADYMRAMREEVIPAINEDLRLQALMAARLRLGLPVDHEVSDRPGHTAEGTETRDEQIDPALQTQGADNAAK